MSLLALDERRRIDHDHVEAAPLGVQRLHHVERIAANHRGLQAVRRRGRLQAFQRRRRRIDAGDFGGAGSQRAEPPRAEVAEDIEHARAADVLAQRQPIRGLVEEPAGLLARCRAAR